MSVQLLSQKGRIAETEAAFENLFGATHAKYSMAELTKSEKGDEVDNLKFSELFYGRHFRGTYWFMVWILVSTLSDN